MNRDVRWKQRFSNYKKAVAQLTEFIEKGELNKFEVQGLIQCFEYTFELAWKTMKDYLEMEGFDVKSPRTTIQTAFQIQLVEDGHTWIDALEKRNLMSHTYNEEIVKEVEELIRNNYYPLIKELCSKLEELE
ncbi:nucleotidyltransferase substrate binding protein, HI0074 family [Caloramator quimbayensis]|uniref:Nucleotidyltransferase substrate binding protein, HI0074 family n=1 Tax=Caloramator quimbayensis TaxID=1147123 RepID=A0A1T4WL05_9CLOT|nr:nucleotidyltransferase substrate binding protein [Caloramator quimbayensis]SKA77585.1 nucleotidyltransferase substrate binding protein, HI0074 family [Caloramator quimbayensis]